LKTGSQHYSVIGGVLLTRKRPKASRQVRDRRGVGNGARLVRQKKKTKEIPATEERELKRAIELYRCEVKGERGDTKSVRKLRQEHSGGEPIHSREPGEIEAIH